MTKMGMVLATTVALLGATTGWAQDAEESESVAAAAVAEPATGNSGCCEEQNSCRSRWSGRGLGNCDRADCQSKIKGRSPRRTGCDKGCGRECSLSAICDWLCFRREHVLCPKGPARRLPPLYTFFPCEDCGDGCGHGTGCATGDCCSK